VRILQERAGFLLTLALLSALGAVASGCGGGKLETEGEEGAYVRADDGVYQVQLTRRLNPRQRPDDTLLRGQGPAPADEEYLAVFLTIRNQGSKPYQPPRDMKVVDTIGNEYLPLDATQSGLGLDFGHPIPPGEVAPPIDSVAAQGPDGAAMVLFRVKLESSTDNLPLELEVPTSEKSGTRITLDV
jgi:hypothetical protein